MIVLLLVPNFVLMIVLWLVLNFVLMIDMSHMTHTLLANSRENDPGATCSHSSPAASQASLAWRNCSMQCVPLPCCQRTITRKLGSSQATLVGVAGVVEWWCGGGGCGVVGVVWLVCPVVGTVELVGVVGVEELVGVVGTCGGPVVGVLGQ